MTEHTALIIEDDMDLATIYRQALQGAGYVVDNVYNGLLASARIDSEEEPIPDLIILDMHLPEVGGVTLHRQIRNDERYAHTRIIVATADARLADSFRGKGDLVMVKPVSFVQLRELAKRLLESG